MPVFEVDVNFSKKNSAGLIVPDTMRYPFIFADDESDAVSVAHYFTRKNNTDLICIDGGDVCSAENNTVFRDPSAVAHVIAMMSGRLVITDGFLTDYISVRDNGSWVRESDQLPVSDATREWIDQYAAHHALMEDAKRLSDRLSDLDEYSGDAAVPAVAEEAATTILNLAVSIVVAMIGGNEDGAEDGVEDGVVAQAGVVADALFDPESFSGDDVIPDVANRAISIIRILCIELRAAYFVAPKPAGFNVSLMECAPSDLDVVATAFLDNENRCDRYKARIVHEYLNGRENVYGAYLAAYGASHDVADSKNDMEYILRCAEQDYADGEHGGAVYQEIFNELELDAFDVPAIKG